eukprot:382873-Prorocentrum_minimum.AAC.2
MGSQQGEELAHGACPNPAGSHGGRWEEVDGGQNGVPSLVLPGVHVHETHVCATTWSHSHSDLGFPLFGGN